MIQDINIPKQFNNPESWYYTPVVFANKIASNSNLNEDDINTIKLDYIFKYRGKP